MKVIKIMTSNKEVERKLRNYFLEIGQDGEEMFIRNLDLLSLGKLLQYIVQEKIFEEVTFLQIYRRTEEEKWIIELMKHQSYMTMAEIAQSIPLNKQVVSKVLQDLEEEGKVLRLEKSKWSYKKIIDLDKFPKKRTKEEEMILSYIKDKPLVTRKELIEATTLDTYSVDKYLSILEKEGEVSKIARGTWKYKDAIGTEEFLEKKIEEERKEKEKILSYIKDKYFVTPIELRTQFSFSAATINKYLSILEKEGEVSKIARGTWKYKDAIGTEEFLEKKIEEEREKKEKILSYMKDKYFVTPIELRTQLSFSTATIDKYLFILEEEGEIYKVPNIARGARRYKDAPSIELFFEEKEERSKKEKILCYMKDKYLVTAKELTEQLSFSIATIYKYLLILEEEGEIYKVPGIAKSVWVYKDVTHIEEILNKQEEEKLEREKILFYIRERCFATRNELRKQLSFSNVKIDQYLSILEKKGEISKLARGTWKYKDAHNIPEIIENKEMEELQIKEEILSYIKDKLFVTRKELLIETKIDVSKIKKYLRILEKEGKIYKITRGTWRYKDAHNIPEFIENKEKEELQIKEKILSCMADKPFVTRKELLTTTKLNSYEMTKYLKVLEEEGEISKFARGKWRYKNVFI